MAISAIYPKPNTSKPSKQNRVYPYLLTGLTISKPNVVWPTDITYIRLQHGFVYLAAVINWYSRKVYNKGVGLSALNTTMPLVQIQALVL